MSKPRTEAGRALFALLAEADVTWPDQFTRIGRGALSEFIARIEAESLDAARKAVSDRYDDLRWCNKEDDCHTLAEGAALALSDVEHLAAIQTLERKRG